MQASYSLLSTTRRDGSRFAQHVHGVSPTYHFGIHSLPVELLAGIFAYLLPVAIYVPDQESWEDKEGRNWSYLGAIMLVCHGWYATVHSFPLLWTYVNLYNWTLPPQLWARNLVLSGNLPLDVVVDIDQFDQERLRSLIGHVGRIRSLVIVVNGGNEAAETNILGAAFSKVSAPRLEHLYVRPRSGCEFREDEAGRDIRHLFLGGLPSLRTFNVTGVAHWREGLSNALTELRVDLSDTDVRTTTMSEVIATLRDSSASLRAVSLEDIFDPDMEQDYGDIGGRQSKEKINLSQLESLKIDIDHFSPLRHLLHTLILPLLRSFPLPLGQLSSIWTALISVVPLRTSFFPVHTSLLGQCRQ